MNSGSIVLMSAALRRADPPRPGVERLDRQERGDEPDGQQERPGLGGTVRGSSGRPTSAPATANTAAVAVIITAVVTAASPAGSAAAGASLPSRSRRSPDSRAERMIQTE